jgi:hypothetical protein
MAEQAPQQQPQPKQQSKRSGKSASQPDDKLAPVAGSYEEARAPEDTPGDPAHLGSDRPYEGGESPFVDQQSGS